MRVPVFIAAVLLAGSALAQTAPAPSTDPSAQPPADSVQPQVVVTEEATPPPVQEKLICRSERPMGSNIARRRLCRTASQIAEDQRNARQMMRQTDRASSFQPPPPKVGGG